MNVGVSVVWATAEHQDVVTLELPRGATVAAAIDASGLVPRHAIDLALVRVGIYGRLVRLETTLADGDRVELYRPLAADPKQARRDRALAKPLPKLRPRVKRRSSA